MLRFTECAALWHDEHSAKGFVYQKECLKPYSRQAFGSRRLANETQQLSMPWVPYWEYSNTHEQRQPDFFRIENGFSSNVGNPTRKLTSKAYQKGVTHLTAVSLWNNLEKKEQTFCKLEYYPDWHISPHLLKPAKQVASSIIPLTLRKQ